MCECNFCKRNLEFIKVTEKINDKEIQDFFRNILDYIIEVEEDLDFSKIYLKNLKIKYPEIYQEVTKI